MSENKKYTSIPEVEDFLQEIPEPQMLGKWADFFGIATERQKPLEDAMDDVMDDLHKKGEMGKYTRIDPRDIYKGITALAVTPEEVAYCNFQAGMVVMEEAKSASSGRSLEALAKMLGVSL